MFHVINVKAFLLFVCIDLSLASTNPTCPNCPAVTYWTQCTGKKGYSSQLSDVQKIEYSSSYVYITSTSIPGTYTVGTSGWADDPLTVYFTHIGNHQVFTCFNAYKYQINWQFIGTFNSIRL